MKGWAIPVWLTASLLWGDLLHCPEEQTARQPQTTPETVLQKEGWVYKVWITAKGTRSEGRIARLYHHDKEICPDGNATLSTPFGLMEYVDAPHIWGWHGWRLIQNPSDKPAPVKTVPLPSF